MKVFNTLSIKYEKPRLYLKLKYWKTYLLMYKQQLQSVVSELHEFTKVYTDGSKTDNDVGAAIVF